MMRGVVDSYVTATGYGKYGDKLGQGVAPPGWPVDVPWAGYTGAGRSGLTNNHNHRHASGCWNQPSISCEVGCDEEPAPKADDLIQD